jgi:hypothetical protein
LAEAKMNFSRLLAGVAFGSGGEKQFGVIK